jgi:hypothetical protein
LSPWFSWHCAESHQTPRLRPQPFFSQSFAAWSTADIQTDRAAAALAATSAENVLGTARAVLGFATYVALRAGEPCLEWLLEGPLLAGYVTWSLVVRCARANWAVAAAPRRGRC